MKEKFQKLKENIKVKLNDIKTANKLDIAVPALIAFASVVAIAGFSLLGIYIAYVSEGEKTIDYGRKIENSVQENNNIGNFELDSIKVKAEDGAIEKFNLKVYGNLKQSGRDSRYVCLNYNIDKQTYEKFSKINSIEYFRDTQGKICNFKDDYPNDLNIDTKKVSKEIMNIVSSKKCDSVETFELSDIPEELQAKVSGINFAVREKMPDEITVDDIINEQITGQKPVAVEMSL